MTALKILGFVLLGLLGLVVLLLVLLLIALAFRLVLHVTWLPEKHEIYGKWGPVRLTFYPRSGKKKKEKPEEEQDEPEEAGKKPKGKLGDKVLRTVRSLTVSDILEMIRLFGKTCLRRIRIGILHLNLRIGTPSADRTAILYGEATAAVFPLLGRLDGAGLLRDAEVHIEPVFTSETTTGEGETELSFRPIHLIPWALRVLPIILK